MVQVRLVVPVYSCTDGKDSQKSSVIMCAWETTNLRVSVIHCLKINDELLILLKTWLSFHYRQWRRTVRLYFSDFKCQAGLPLCMNKTRLPQIIGRMEPLTARVCWLFQLTIIENELQRYGAVDFRCSPGGNHSWIISSWINAANHLVEMSGDITILTSKIIWWAV